MFVVVVVVVVVLIVLIVLVVVVIVLNSQFVQMVKFQNRVAMLEI